MSIHPTAIIAPGARIGEGVSIGPYSVIGDDVWVGEGTTIASHVCIEGPTEIGPRCQIHHGAVMGTIPQDLKFGGERSWLRIGPATVIRELVTINRGTRARGETRIGENVLLMAYAHVAHDCVIGDHVILANAVNLAGHVEIHDFAIIGGIVPIHQFVKVGAHSIVGGGFRVPKDVCPYTKVAGYPLRVVGLNTVGLSRRGFSKEAIGTLKKLYRILFRSQLNVSQALERLRQEVEETEEVRTVMDFIQQSQRGIIL